MKALMGNLALSITNFDKLNKQRIAELIVRDFHILNQQATKTAEKQEEQSQKKGESKKEEDKTNEEDKKEEEKKEEEEGWRERDEKYLDLLRRLNAGPMKINPDQHMALEEKKRSGNMSSHTLQLSRHITRPP